MVSTLINTLTHYNVNVHERYSHGEGDLVDPVSLWKPCAQVVLCATDDGGTKPSSGP